MKPIDYYRAYSVSFRQIPIPLLRLLYRHFGHSVWRALLQDGPEDIDDVYRWRPRQYHDVASWLKIRGQRCEVQLHNKPRAGSLGSSAVTSPALMTAQSAQSYECFYQSSHPDWGHDPQQLTMTRWKKSPVHRSLCRFCLAYFQSTDANMRIESASTAEGSR